jgi:SAM-dependent methyltransferase
MQVDHPEVDDLQDKFRANALESYILSIIHRWPYEHLISEVEGKVVLELGCNVGYGTVIYALNADKVNAVDTSHQAIEKAKKVNARKNIEYVLLGSWQIPLPDDSVDITALFQVIEHIALDKLDAFLREIRRVTRGDGKVIFTTPNRKIRLLPFQRPWNTFHVKEYSAKELQKLLLCYFEEVKVEGLFGPEPLNEIERRRVRQKTLSVYIKNPFSNIYKYIKNKVLSHVPRSFKERVKKMQPKNIASRQESSMDMSASGPALATENVPAFQYTTTDLKLCSDELHAALDLTATVLRVK